MSTDPRTRRLRRGSQALTGASLVVLVAREREVHTDRAAVGSYSIARPSGGVFPVRFHSRAGSSHQAVPGGPRSPDVAPFKLIGQCVAVDLVRAVTSLANQLGVHVDAAVPLRSTNNLVVWLSPSGVVAKVAVSPSRSSNELLAAQVLSARGAPVVAPAPGVGTQVHHAQGHDVTFWTHVPQEGTEAPTSRSIASALAALHEVMAHLTTSPGLHLPPCEAPITDTIAALDRPSFAAELRTPDRQLLRDALVDGRHALKDRSRWQPIHGSPHRFNILVADGAPQFIDLETIAQGPVEWDLAHLEPTVVEHYPTPVDDRLLKSLRVVISAMTSAHCWHGLHRGRDMRDHAEHHLAIVRTHRPRPDA